MSQHAWEFLGFVCKKITASKKNNLSGSGYICTRCWGSYVGLVKREGGYGPNNFDYEFNANKSCNKKKVQFSFLSSIFRLFFLYISNNYRIQPQTNLTFDITDRCSCNKITTTQIQIYRQN